MSNQLNQNDVKRIVAVATAICMIGIAALLYVFTSDNDLTSAPDEVASLPPLVATEIHSGLDYALDAVAKDKAVPALFIDSLDVNLDRIRDVDEKKATFFRIMLPHIARENDRIRAERSRIYNADGDVPADLFKKYKVDDGSVDELLRRVDVIPASLVLAQAALESGWGTSRFARKGNNFFGMRTYRKDVEGMDPKEADGFKVMVFRDIGHSVRVYMKNLNTNEAYAKFRQARAKERASAGAPTGHTMTNYLTSYSEIPEKYGKRLRGMINRNDLHRFDGVRVAKN